MHLLTWELHNENSCTWLERPKGIAISPQECVGYHNVPLCNKIISDSYSYRYSAPAADRDLCDVRSFRVRTSAGGNQKSVELSWLTPSEKLGPKGNSVLCSLLAQSPRTQVGFFHTFALLPWLDCNYHLYYTPRHKQIGSKPCAPMHFQSE